MTKRELIQKLEATGLPDNAEIKVEFADLFVGGNVQLPLDSVVVVYDEIVVASTKGLV